MSECAKCVLFCNRKCPLLLLNACMSECVQCVLSVAIKYPLFLKACMSGTSVRNVSFVFSNVCMSERICLLCCQISHLPKACPSVRNVSFVLRSKILLASLGMHVRVCKMCRLFCGSIESSLCFSRRACSPCVKYVLGVAIGHTLCFSRHAPLSESVHVDDL